MTGTELKAARHRLRLSTAQMGRALGYRGKPNSISVNIRQMETGLRQISPAVARLAEALEYVPPPILVAWIAEQSAKLSDNHAQRDDNSRD